MAAPRSVAAALLCAAMAWSQLPAQATYQWALPSGFPPPAIPADNPITEAKIESSMQIG
jgi:cytochrome c peroxidase